MEKALSHSKALKAQYEKGPLYRCLFRFLKMTFFYRESFFKAWILFSSGGWLEKSSIKLSLDEICIAFTDPSASPS